MSVDPNKIPSSSVIIPIFPDLPTLLPQEASERDAKTELIALQVIQQTASEEPSSPCWGSRIIYCIRDFLVSAKDALICLICLRCCKQKTGAPTLNQPPQGISGGVQVLPKEFPKKGSAISQIAKNEAPLPLPPTKPALPAFRKFDIIAKTTLPAFQQKIIQSTALSPFLIKTASQSNEGLAETSSIQNDDKETALVTKDSQPFPHSFNFPELAHELDLALTQIELHCNTWRNQQTTLTRCARALDEYTNAKVKHIEAREKYLVDFKAYEDKLAAMSKTVPASHQKQRETVLNELESLKGMQQFEKAYNDAEVLSKQSWEHITHHLNSNGREILKGFHLLYQNLEERFFQENSPIPQQNDLEYIAKCNRLFRRQIQDPMDIIEGNDHVENTRLPFHELLHSFLVEPIEGNDSFPDHNELNMVWLKSLMPCIPMTLQSFRIPELEATPNTVRGIPQIGNNCYLNAGLQMMFNYPPFREALIKTLKATFPDDTAHTVEDTGLLALNNGDQQLNKNLILLALTNMVYAYDHNLDLHTPIRSLRDALFHGNAHPELKISALSSQHTADIILCLVNQDMLNVGIHTQRISTKSTGNISPGGGREFHSAWQLGMDNKTTTMQELIEKSFVVEETDDNDLIEREKRMKIIPTPTHQEAQFQVVGEAVRVDQLSIQFDDINNVILMTTDAAENIPEQTYSIRPNFATKILHIDQMYLHETNERMLEKGITFSVNGNQTTVNINNQIEFIYDFTRGRILLEGNDIQTCSRDGEDEVMQTITYDPSKKKKCKISIEWSDSRKKFLAHVHAKTNPNGTALKNGEKLTFQEQRKKQDTVQTSEKQPIILKPSCVKFGRQELSRVQKTTSQLSSTPESLILWVKRFEKGADKQLYKIQKPILLEDNAIEFSETHIARKETSSIESDEASAIERSDSSSSENADDSMAVSSYPSADVNPTHYQLTGFVVHDGGITGGHYRAYIRDRNKQWFHLNDSIVTRCSDREVERERQQLYLGTFVRSDEKVIRKQKPPNIQKKTQPGTCAIL
jgi:hypothetical protein